MPFTDGWTELDPLLRQLKQEVTNALGGEFTIYVEVERDGTFKTKRERYLVKFILHYPGKIAGNFAAANRAAIVDQRTAMYVDSKYGQKPRLFVQVLPQRFLDKMFRAIEEKNKTKIG